jgi:hypothetical protein
VEGQPNDACFAHGPGSNSSSWGKLSLLLLDLSLIIDLWVLSLPNMQAIGQHCCPASKVRLRLTCSAWHQALATQFSTLYIGPGAPLYQHVSSDQHQQRLQLLPAWVLGERLHKAFPAVTCLQLTASSSRDYEDTFVQVGFSCGCCLSKHGSCACLGSVTQVPGAPLLQHPCAQHGMPSWHDAQPPAVVIRSLGSFTGCSRLRPEPCNSNSDSVVVA